MPCLIDTSILIRLANTNDAHYPAAVGAIVELHRREETLFITAQNLIEFRNVATRPLAQNGLGLAAAEADAKAADFEGTYPLLPEAPAIFAAWKALVSALGIIGKQVHDARLAAVCHVHGVTHLLTFNMTHFVCLAAFGPGFVVIDAATI